MEARQAFFCYYRGVIFAPFLLIYVILALAILAFWFVLLEIHVINYAFTLAGLPPNWLL